MSSGSRITSASNPRYRALMKLRQSSRERRKAGLSLLDGTHLVAAYVQHVGKPHELIVGGESAENAELAALVDACGIEPLILSPALFRELSTVATPTGIMALVKTPRPPALPDEPGACVVLEDIQDPGNLGSILRSTAAAGLEEVYLSKHAVQAWSPRALRAGMGAHFALRIHEGVDLAALLGSYPGTVLAAATDGALPVYAADLRGRIALLLGNEGGGLSAGIKRLAHRTIAVPMSGVVESLNVAAAAAVCLFERVRQLTVTRDREA
jgi:TrmH family RNA methyltransferase